MISLVTEGKRRRLAHAAVFTENCLAASTNAGIVKNAGVSEYPRTAPAYYIRTPSPDGQSDAVRSRLPVFSFGNQNAAGAFDKSRNEKGLIRCLQGNLHWYWQLAQGLRPVVKPWANKLLAARPSARVLRLSRTTVSQKAPQSARRATWHTASFIRPTVTDLAPAGATQDVLTAQVLPARFFVREMLRPCDRRESQRRTRHVQ